jgi:lipid II:glycine glycyltransferase (peptidoglycan interpeptide bridge formation enzyme)
MAGIHDATAPELEAWDAHTVDVPGGHVFQSRTWGEFRARHGWRPRFLVLDDGFCVLTAERPWPVVGGAGAYVGRGPVSSGEPAETTADRLRAVAEWLVARGVDVVSSDAEIPADTGYPAMLRARGFHPIEEVQPSRHRMSVPLDDGLDSEARFAKLPTTLRQRIRGAEKKGVRLTLFDTRPPDPALREHFELAPAEALTPEALVPVFERHLELVAATAQRRQFPTPPRSFYVDGSSHLVAAGLGFHLEARSPTGELLAAALFYRHGQRITYALSADRVDVRKTFPGIVHLMLWRVIQMAMREGRAEMDLAGVDIPGARHRPGPDDEMHGLYAFKEQFGARWLELSGNHEWVARPWRYAAGRIAARLARSR